MAKITIKYDPTGAIGNDKRFIDDSGKCALDIINEEMPVNFSHIVATLNGKTIRFPKFDGEMRIIDRGDEEELTRKLTTFDDLKIMCLQSGVELSAAAIYWIVTAVVAVAAVGVAVWAYNQGSYSSSTSTDSGDTQDSLSGQTNTTSLYDAIPDRYGSQVIYPDLIDNEAHSVYSSNKQTLTQFMSLGIGEFDWNDVYLGSTQLGLVSGATVTEYAPVNGVTTVPSYFYNRSVTQVSRSDLDGPGYQKSAIASNSSSIFFTYDSTNDLGRIDVAGSNADPIFNNYFSVGDSISLTYADSIIGDDGLGGTAYYDLSGTYTVEEVDERYIVFSDAATVVSDWVYIDSDFGTGETSYQQGSDNVNIILQSTSTGLTYQGPFYTAIPARGFMLDFGFYSGLKGSVTLSIVYSVYTDLDGDAIDSGTLSVTYSANTYDQKNYTYSFNYGDADDNSYYFRVAVARTTEESTDASEPDTIKWDRFASYSEITNKTFNYGPTIIKVVIPYSTSAISPNSNEVNITATRKTIKYNVDSGNVVTELTPTTTFADALLHLYSVTHERDSSEIDLDSLYEISNRIGYPYNEFSYSFDDLTQSLEDKMTIICNVARVYFYWDGQMYRFYRDEAMSGSPALITRTDIAHPDDRDYARTFNPNLPTAYDSIKLEYMYPDRNNEAAYIRLTYDVNGNITTGLGINPYSITLSGCRNKQQALNRAHLEIRKLLYNRWTLKDTLMKNAYLLDLGDFVQYTDVFRTDVYGGEILSINGADVTLSSTVTLDPDTTYELWYNDDEMNVYGPFDIAHGNGEKTNTISVITESDLENAYTRGGLMGNSVQVGSRFTINNVTTGNKELFIISAKEGVDDQHVNITMTQYDERVYDYD